MKIYKYIEQDIDLMVFNHWGRRLKSSRALKKLKEFLKSSEAYTIYDEKAVAVLAFREYEKGCWECGIIADESFNTRHVVKMKWLINKCIEKYKPKRIQTLSEDNDKLNKWHEFLGLQKEKTGVTIGKEKNLVLWSMEWEQD